MTTQERQEYAAQLKREMNCCQAVLVAFADVLGRSEAELLRMGSGFGSGMGTMEGTCGALVGAELLLGIIKDGAPVMRDARTLHRAFTETCGASLCKDLKGRDTGKVLCSCDDCVRAAVDLVEAFAERE
jgi:Putative redox-active protein (C_GCAxxG_C_C).